MARDRWIDDELFDDDELFIEEEEEEEEEGEEEDYDDETDEEEDGGAAEEEEDSGSEEEGGETTEFDAELLAIAGEFGLTEAEVREQFRTPDELERQLVLAARRERVVSEKKTRAAEEAAKKEKSEADRKALVFSIDDEDIDEGLRKAINPVLAKLHEHHQNVTEQLTQQLNEARTALSSAQQSMFYSQFDHAVAKWGDAYRRELGDESVLDVDPKSPTGQNLAKVLEEMETIVAGCQLRGRPIPANRPLFERACSAVFGNRIKSKAREELKKEVSNRRKGFTHRTTNRKSTRRTPEDPTEAAHEAASAVAAEKGMDRWGNLDRTED